MEIRYEIYSKWSESQVRYFSSMGLKVELGKFSKLKLSMEQFDANEIFIRESGCLISWGTNFVKNDFDNVNYLVLNSVSEIGYPEPSDDFGYLNIVYDLKDFCKKCGTGAIQKEPFRIKKTSKHDKTKIFQLIWIYDELFVCRDLYTSVFKPLGIDSNDVLDYKTKRIIPSIVQIIFPISKEKLDMTTTPFKVCEVCSRKKYTPFFRGYFPNFSSNNLALFKTNECFGTDSLAYKRRILSASLVNKLISSGSVKLDNFVPVAKSN